MFFEKFKFDKSFFILAVSIAVPLMVQQVLVNLTSLVDNLMIGSLGSVALSSVSLVNKFFLISTFAIFGLSAAASVFMAQYMGANDKEKLKQSFRFMVVMSVVLNVLFFVFSYFFPYEIVRYFTNDGLVIKSSIDYIKIIMFTFIPVSITISINNAIRTTGETKILLFISMCAIITNAFFNYCMIFGNLGFKRMGVEGAAIATLISRYLEMALSIFVLWIKKYDFNTKILEIFKIDLSLAKSIFLKAIPLAFNEILWSFGMATIFKFYSYYGIEVMAGFSITNTITDIFYTLMGGMSIVTIFFVSKSLGANKLDEARSYAYKLIGLSFFVSIFFGVLMYLSSFLVFYIYRGMEYQSIVVSSNMIKIQSLMFWIYVMTTEIYFILRSGGDMKNTFIIDSGYMWVVSIPFLYILIFYFKFDYLKLYATFQIVNIVKLFFSYYLFKKEGWLINLTVSK